MNRNTPEEDRCYIVHWETGDKSANRSWSDYKSACSFIRKLDPCHGSLCWYDKRNESFINPMFQLFSFQTHEVVA